jgi:hypothetical protein
VDPADVGVTHFTKMHMRFKHSLLFLGLAAAGCSTDSSIVIEVQNESDLALQEKPVIINRTEIENGWSEGHFPLVLSASKDTLAAQLDDVDGDGIWDQLFVLVDFNPLEKKKLTLSWIKDEPVFEKRTSVRLGVRDSLNDMVKQKQQDTFLPHELPWTNGYQPYQADGPMWENDKAGFRSYLDGRNSKDVFGKKVAYMSPETVGVNAEGLPEDNYHVMADWGRDILSVGNSVGLGGISLMIEDRFRRLGVVNGDSVGNVDSTTFTIYQEGPIRSIANFDYIKWRPLEENRTYNVHEKIEIWPGFHGYKSTVTFDELKGDETLIVGLVNSRTDKPLTVVYENDDWAVLATHDKQTYEKEWYLGLALVVPKKGYLGYIDAPKEGPVSTSYLAKFKMEAGVPISYYSIACWELRDPRFTEEKFFFDYLKDFTGQLSARVNIKVK